MSNDRRDDDRTRLEDDTTRVLSGGAGAESADDKLKLPGYRVVKKLGSGGMGKVFLAWQLEPVDRQVAIKLIQQRIRSAASEVRFLVERQALAQMHHPAIAQIFEAGTNPDGYPYFAMEYVPGETLMVFCSRHRLGLRERLELFVRICQGVSHAHQKGLIHRDLKPGNILVTRIDEVPRPKIIDFGIAATESSASERRHQGTAGTPVYMSPELFDETTGIDIRADIYSLGVILCELLTDCRPYPDRLFEATDTRLIRQRLSEQAPPAPSRLPGSGDVDLERAAKRRRTTPERLVRQIRGDLDAITLKAIAHDRDQRYASVPELADDIRRYLDHQPVRAVDGGRLYLARRFVSRHRAGVAAAGAAFVLLAGALIVVDKQRGRARIAAERAESAVQFLTDMIQRADPFENAEAPTLAGSLKLAVADIDNRFADQPALEADLRYAIGYALQNLGEIETARKLLERALKLRQDVGSTVDRAEAHDGLAIVAWWESDFDRATPHFQQALALLEGEHGERATIVRVNVLANWAAMLIDAGEYAESERLAERARQLSEGTAAISLDTRAAIYSTLATARHGLNQNDAALAAFERTMDLQRQATGENHPSFAIVLNNLALLYYGMDRLDDALAALERSVAIRRATLGESHPQTATGLFNLARLQTAAGQLEAAEDNARRALAVAAAGYDDGHPRIGKAHEALAAVLSERGRIDEALLHARSAQALYRTASGVDPAWVAAIDDIIADLTTRDRPQP